MKNKKLLFYFVLIIFLCLPAIKSLLRPGFFSSHDGEWFVIKLGDFHRAVRDGHFPVRWTGNLNYGYGYPIFNFSYPGPYYLGEFFYFFTRSLTLSLKIVFILSFLLSGISMFIFSKEFFGNRAGLISSFLYVYAPYRFVDVYVRGSVGEALSFVFMPLILWSIHKIKLKTKNKKLKICILIGAISYALLILSHNIIAMLFTGFLFIGLLAYWLIGLLKRKSMVMLLCCYVVMLFIGLGLSAFFWLPAIMEMKYTILNQATISNPVNHLLTIGQLIKPSWNYGASGSADQMSFQIGIIQMIMFIFATIILLKQKTVLQNKFNSYMLICLYILTIVSVFMMTKWFGFIWQSVPLLKFIQFPWRLLAFVVLGTSFLAGLVIKQFQNSKLKILLMLIIIFTAFWLNKDYWQPKEFVNREEMWYFTNDSPTAVANEYMPIWVKNFPSQRPENKIEIIEGEGQISDLVIKTHWLKFNLKMTDSGKIRMNTVHFPGWKVFLDTKETKIDYENNNGLIVFKAPSGESQVFAKFVDTKIRSLANRISLVTGLVVFFAILI